MCCCYPQMCATLTLYYGKGIFYNGKIPNPKTLKTLKPMSSTAWLEGPTAPCLNPGLLVLHAPGSSGKGPA